MTRCKAHIAQKFSELPIKRNLLIFKHITPLKCDNSITFSELSQNNITAQSGHGWSVSLYFL